MCKRPLALLTCLLLFSSTAADAGKTKPTDRTAGKPAGQMTTTRPETSTPPPQTVPMHGAFQDLGIRIRTPGAGQKYYTREPMTVAYRVTAENAGPGIMDFSLIHSETLTPVARKTHRHPFFRKQDRTEPLRLEQQFVWTVPDVQEGHYHLLATMGSIVGSSHQFEIADRPVINRPADRTIGPAAASPIVIHRPSAGATIAQGNTLAVEWSMPDAMSLSACGNSVELRPVRLSDNHEWVYRRLSVTPGRNTVAMTFDPGVFRPGQYRLRIVSSTGCTAQSPVFTLAACDYALEGVRFSDGRTLESGISAGTGQYVTGAFSVTVRWNGIRLPASFSPGTPWGNLLRVRSTLTGTYINDPPAGTNFTYESARGGGLITVYLPFRFVRDAVPAMMTATRRIPLEFSFHPTGVSTDMDDTNNALRSDMKILGTAEDDMVIRAVSGDFSLRRRTSAAPLTEYRFTQRFEMTNLSRNEAGGPPVPRNVNVRWEIQYKQPDRSDWLVKRSGSMMVSAVAGVEWKNATCSGSFPESPPDDIPSGRRFRLVLTADPGHALMDPNRANNTVAIAFRIVD